MATHTDNGTTKANRKYETLEYYLLTNPKNKEERDHNKVNINNRMKEVGVKMYYEEIKDLPRY